MKHSATITIEGDCELGTSGELKISVAFDPEMPEGTPAHMRPLSHLVAVVGYGKILEVSKGKAREPRAKHFEWEI